MQKCTRMTNCPTDIERVKLCLKKVKYINHRKHSTNDSFLTESMISLTHSKIKAMWKYYSYL